MPLFVALGILLPPKRSFTMRHIVIAKLNFADLSIFGILIASAVIGLPIYIAIWSITGTFLFITPSPKSPNFSMVDSGVSFVTLMFICWSKHSSVYLGRLFGPRFRPDELPTGQFNINYSIPWDRLYLLPNLWFGKFALFALDVCSLVEYQIDLLRRLSFVFNPFTCSSNFLSNRNIGKPVAVENPMDPFGIEYFNFQTRYSLLTQKTSFYPSIAGNLADQSTIPLGLELNSYFSGCPIAALALNYFSSKLNKRNLRLKQRSRAKYKWLKQKVYCQGEFFCWKLPSGTVSKTLNKNRVFKNIFKRHLFKSILLVDW